MAEEQSAGQGAPAVPRPGEVCAGELRSAAGGALQRNRANAYADDWQNPGIGEAAVDAAAGAYPVDAGAAAGVGMVWGEAACGEIGGDSGEGGAAGGIGNRLPG